MGHSGRPPTCTQKHAPKDARGGSWWLVVVRGGSWWFVVVRGGSWWFVVVRGGSWWFVEVRGGSWWFVVVRGGSWWFVVVRGGSWWFVVVCALCQWGILAELGGWGGAADPDRDALEGNGPEAGDGHPRETGSVRLQPSNAPPPPPKAGLHPPESAVRPLVQPPTTAFATSIANPRPNSKRGKHEPQDAPRPQFLSFRRSLGGGCRTSAAPPPVPRFSYAVPQGFYAAPTLFPPRTSAPPGGCPWFPSPALLQVCQKHVHEVFRRVKSQSSRPPAFSLPSSSQQGPVKQKSHVHHAF